MMDQKQGQASSHVPMGFSIRISCAYGIHDCGSRSNQVPVTMGRCAWPAAAAVAAAAVGLLPSVAASSVLLLPTLLLGDVPLAGCWLPGRAFSAASKLAEDAVNGRLSCSCEGQANPAAVLAAAAGTGGRQVPGDHPAIAEPLLECNDCNRSPSSWAAAASALGRPPPPSSVPLRLAQATSIPPRYYCKS